MLPSTPPEPDGDGFHEEARPVRPYTVTGGRTRSRGEHLPIEALVRATAPAPARISQEKRQILNLTGERYLSIAEISAHVRLPVGVVRVLVGDLTHEQLVSVHGMTAIAAGQDPASTLSVLESVLDGISAL
jgi:hypothetical protein